MSVVSLSELQNNMEGCNTTSNWDAIVSFHADLLNKFLADQYAKSELVDSFSTPYSYVFNDIADGMMFYINGVYYDFSLETPLVTFDTGSNKDCSITMNIKSLVKHTSDFVLELLEDQPQDVTWKSSKETEEAYFQFSSDKKYVKYVGNSSTFSISQGKSLKKDSVFFITKATSNTVELGKDKKYQLKANQIPLSAVDGNVEGGQKLPNNDKTIVFPPGSEKRNNYYVSIDFASGRGNFDISPCLPDTSATEQRNLLQDIRDYFSMNVSDVDYSLCGINNVSNKDNIILCPKSFIFVANGTDILSIYLQLSTGSPQGNPKAVFAPQEKNISPIPSGYSASIIFNNNIFDIFVDKLRKKYKILQSNSVMNTPSPSNPGHRLTITPKSSIKIRVKSYDKGSDLPDFSTNNSIDSFKLSIDSSNPINLYFSPQGTIDVSWSVKKDGIHFSNISDGFTHVGELNLDISFKKSILASVNSKSVDAQINISGKDYSRSMKYHTPHIPAFSTGIATYNSTPKWVKSYIDKCLETTKLPTFNISFNSINFFAVTNVLCPNKQIINIDSKAGLMFPWDMLLVGNVANSK